jgi:hypothetical protein
MQATFRLLLCAAILLTGVTAALPVMACGHVAMKADCCANMKMDTPAKGCGHHAPKQDKENQCCPACFNCITYLFTPATRFVYPPSDAEFLVSDSDQARSRLDRPPVPPPRC